VGERRARARTRDSGLAMVCGVEWAVWWIEHFAKAAVETSVLSSMLENQTGNERLNEHDKTLGKETKERLGKLMKGNLAFGLVIANPHAQVDHIPR
jgi:hypothetical protein